MTAKTAKERAGAQETEKIEEADGSAAEPEPRTAAKKKVRRVRVIEVIDDDEDLDEDLGEVLDAIDTDGEDTKPADTKTEAAAEPEKAEKKAVKAEGVAKPGRLLTVFGSPWFTTVLVALVLAAVASWALVRWHSLSGKESDRQAVTAAAAKFGDVVYSYDPAYVQAAIDHNREMMAGDLRSQYVASANSYKEFFAKNKWTWSSKTSKVYLAEMQGDLASAVIVIDINIRMTEGPYAVPAAHFTLGMVKENGAWKVSSMKAAGSEAAATAQQGSGGGLPSLSGTQGTGGSEDKKN
ncbi:MAG: hypothetical protein ACRDOO_14605 [Actinomadura sp.]